MLELQTRIQARVLDIPWEARVDVYFLALTFPPFLKNRIRNKAKLKPLELVDPRNAELRSTLQKAEFAMMAGNDVVDQDGEDEQGPTGSASDSE